MWVFLTVIVVCGIVTDTYIKKQKIDLKKVEKELELEQLKLQSFERETERLRLELQGTKQRRLQTEEELSCGN